MSPPQDTGKAIVDLPIELRQAILGFMPDLSSLINTTKSCSAFYQAFVEAHQRIVSQVFLREMDAELLPEAISVLESSHKTWTRESLLEFITRTLDSREVSKGSWSMTEAISTVGFYHQVHDLAIDFATKSIRGRCDGTPLSQAELNRFERAFYRYELYCNLFKDYNYPFLSLEEQKYVFFSKFSPWENEQLDCVHGYLLRLIAPGKLSDFKNLLSILTRIDFDDIAEHDIVWGEMCVDYSDHHNPYYLEPTLARGISSICLIVAADGYAAKYDLFDSEYPQWSDQFLYEALNAANASDDGIELEDYTIDDEISNITAPFFRDVDPGPEYVWRSLHEMRSRAYFVNSESLISTRGWGYVVWDRSRLDGMGIFEDDWVEPEAEPPSEDIIRRREQRIASTQCRGEIYWAGGRGWWSFSDESKVAWPNRREPNGQPTRSR